MSPKLVPHIASDIARCDFEPERCRQSFPRTSPATSRDMVFPCSHVDQRSLAMSRNPCRDIATLLQQSPGSLHRFSLFFHLIFVTHSCCYLFGFFVAFALCLTFSRACLLACSFAFSLLAILLSRLLVFRLLACVLACFLLF